MTDMELKARHVVDVYDNYSEHPCEESSQVYPKSEVDKVIADKDAEIAEMKEQVHYYAQGLYVMQARAEKEARHHKYKRCLAMAEWCERKRIDAANYRIPRKKWEFYDKWRWRWLELADKFKEAK